MMMMMMKRILLAPLLLLGTSCADAFKASYVPQQAPLLAARKSQLQLPLLHRLRQPLRIQTAANDPLASSAATSSRLPRPLSVRGATTPSSPTSLNAVPAAAAAAVVIPSLKTIALSCLLPTSLGFVKSEYGVSYGYGTSIAILAWLMLKQFADLTSWSWPAWHAAALLFYGIRLDLFLAYRELTIPRFRKFREKIEAKAEPNRLARTPFIVSCALLYACMASPLFVTCTAAVTTTRLPVKFCIATTWAGFLVAALGDLTKTVQKARRGDEDALITGGIFSILRHPNYTGEAIAWTASCVAAFCAAAAAAAGGHWNTLRQSPHVYSLIASTVGLAGILFVLAMATKGLAKRQEEKHGDTDEYKQWIKRSWVGISL